MVVFRRAGNRRCADEIRVDVEELDERPQRRTELPKARRHGWLDQIITVIALFPVVPLILVVLRIDAARGGTVSSYHCCSQTRPRGGNVTASGSCALTLNCHC
jgi:hypothetical protein